MGSQVLVLIDLDHCCGSLMQQAGSRQQDEEDPLEAGLIRLKRLCLRLVTASANRIHRFKIRGPSFNFRFYSSTGYFVPGDQTHEFLDFAAESIEKLDSALEARFEMLLQGQGSKTSAYDPQDLAKHILRQQPGAQAQSLRKSLEEVAILYSWDRPMLHSPVKFHRTTSTLSSLGGGISKSLSDNKNLVYVISKLPDNPAELAAFMGKKVRTVRDIQDGLFNQKKLSAHIKESDIKVSFVDTSDAAGSDKKTKDLFDKAIRTTVKGCLIPIRSMCLDGPAPAPLSAIVASVGVPPTRQSTVACFFPENGARVEFSSAELTAAPAVDVSSLEVVCSVDRSFFPVAQKWTSHHLLWMRQTQWASAPILHTKKSWLVVRVASSEGLIGALSTVDTATAVLSLLSPMDSALYLHLLKAGPPSSKTDLPPATETLIGTEVKKFVAKMKRIKDSPKPAQTSSLSSSKFQGTWLESWMVPLEPKCGTVSWNSDKSSKMFKDLQRAYLPQPPIQAKTSREMLLEKRLTERRRNSEEKPKGSTAAASTATSRGVALMRLGNQKAEMRRASLEEGNKGGSCGGSGDTAAKAADDQFFARKRELCAKFEQEVAQSPNDLLFSLLGLQHGRISSESEAVELCALADSTVSLVLKNLQGQSDKGGKSVEDVIGDNFLVDTATVGARKTSLVTANRVRDHKLQVLYRMEIHWLLASQEKQRKVEAGILAHLRQISIWGTEEETSGPEQMAKFMNECVTRNYLNHSSDLLCLLFEELGQPMPPQLRAAIFSPSKSDTSSVAPSSVLSQGSEMSYRSIRSSGLAGNPVSNTALERVRKMKRPTSFDSSRLQIQVKGGAVKKQENSRQAAEARATRSRRTTNKTPVKKAPASLANRAKRNLTFDCEPEPVVRRSPRKRLRSESGGGGEGSGEKTPLKKRARLQDATPQKLTPGKSHGMLAPETPGRKTPRRKSDGVKTVAESPDIDSIKQAKVTPRRMAASLSLRRKTSFYSGEVSRNVQKAEEALNASKIQSFTKKNSDESGGEKSTQSQLFPHLVNAKDSPPLKAAPTASRSEPQAKAGEMASPPLPTRKLLFEDVTTPTAANRRKIALTPVPKSASRYQHPAFAQENDPVVTTSAAARLSFSQSPPPAAVSAQSDSTPTKAENSSSGDDSKKSSKRQLFDSGASVKGAGDLGLMSVVATPVKENPSAEQTSADQTSADQTSSDEKTADKSSSDLCEDLYDSSIEKFKTNAIRTDADWSDFEVEKRDRPERLSRSKTRRSNEEQQKLQSSEPAVKPVDEKKEPSRRPVTLTRRVSVSLRRTPSIDLVAKLTPRKIPEPVEEEESKEDVTEKSPDVKRRRSRCKTRLVNRVHNKTTEDAEFDPSDRGCSPSFKALSSANKTSADQTSADNISADQTSASQTPAGQTSVDKTSADQTPNTEESDGERSPPRRNREASKNDELSDDGEVSPVRKRISASIKKRRSRLSRLQSHRHLGGGEGDEDEEEEVVISRKQLDSVDYDLQEGESKRPSRSNPSRQKFEPEKTTNEIETAGLGEESEDDEVVVSKKASDDLEEYRPLRSRSSRPRPASKKPQKSSQPEEGKEMNADAVHLKEDEITNRQLAIDNEEYRPLRSSRSYKPRPASKKKAAELEEGHENKDPTDSSIQHTTKELGEESEDDREVAVSKKATDDLEESRPLRSSRSYKPRPASKKKAEPLEEEHPTDSSSTEEVNQNERPAASKKEMQLLSLMHDLKPLKVKVDRSSVLLVKTAAAPEAAGPFQTPTKNPQLQVEEETTPSRPSRLKRATNRFGIDDVQTLTPSPKAARMAAQQSLPRTPRQQQLVKRPPKTPELHLVRDEDPEMIRDALVSPPPASKDWQIVTSQETPDGKFKIKFGSKRDNKESLDKAKASPASAAPSLHFPLRISRRMSMEIGISAAGLTHAMTRSPSPKKRAHASAAAAANPSSANCQPVTSSNSCPAVPAGAGRTDKENTAANHNHLSSPALQRAAAGEKRKYSPLSSRSLYNLTTSPIINRSLPGSGPSDGAEPPPAKRPRCKASKKLY